MALRQLNPAPDSPTVSQDELNQTMSAASHSILAQIFYQAQELRAKNWRQQDTKPIMERTIPIFRALIASDRENRYHQNHAQLGFGLKDQRKPEWAEAYNELDRAIEIRGKPEYAGWYIYELNRAMCRIMMDEDYRAKQPTKPALRDVILRDLKLAVRVDYLRRIIEADPPTQEWLGLNNLRL